MKLTKDEMQAVVDYLQVQHDTLYEIIVSKDSTEEDRKECADDEKALRKFFLAAKEKGLDISKSMYPLDKKTKRIEEVLNGSRS